MNPGVQAIEWRKVWMKEFLHPLTIPTLTRALYNSNMISSGGLRDRIPKCHLALDLYFDFAEEEEGVTTEGCCDCWRRAERGKLDARTEIDDNNEVVSFVGVFAVDSEESGTDS